MTERETANYRETLKKDLMERCRRNPGYSLRAYARFLQITPSNLSRVLSGKQNLSLPLAKAIAERIFETADEQERFITCVEYAVTKKPSLKARALTRLSQMSHPEQGVLLQAEAMRFLSSWYHFAILDLSSIEWHPMTPAAIAATLGISVLEAKDALERLSSLGLLEQVDGRLRKTHSTIATSNGIYDESIREFHRQMIGKGLSSIDEQDISQRYVRAKTLAIARADMPKIRQLIEKFMSELSEIAARSERADCLQQLNLQLFDLAPKLALKSPQKVPRKKSNESRPKKEKVE